MADNTPPADDVREALADLLMSDRVMRQSGMGRDYAYVEADAICEVFDVRPRGTVTDAEVEAAALVIYEKDAAIYGWDTAFAKASSSTRIRYYHVARAVLEAAREVNNA